MGLGRRAARGLKEIDEGRGCGLDLGERWSRGGAVCHYVYGQKTRMDGKNGIGMTSLNCVIIVD